MDNNVIITGYSNPTSEGVTIHLNKRAKLKNGHMHCDSWYVSWDKIGSALIEGYTEKCEVAELDKLRASNPQ